MATRVSHAMRRHPNLSHDHKYENSLRKDARSSGVISNIIDESCTSLTGGSALSRSMRYAEPWLYGSVRGTPVFLTAAYPSGAPLPPGTGPAAAVLQLCTCTDYLHGTAKSSKNNTANNKGPQLCKKCKGTRLPFNQPGGTLRTKYGTVRGYGSSPAPILTGVRAGTVRASTTSSRPTILPSSTPSIDPYDLMRRSRLSCSEIGSQFRARSSSPNKTKSKINFNSVRSKNENKSSSGFKTGTGGRRSILECDVNPYELMSTNGGNKKETRIKNHYEDVDVKKSSQIPKPKTSKQTKKEACEYEAKFKSILKKPSLVENGTSVVDCTSNGSITNNNNHNNNNNNNNTKSGSHFYLPMPTLNPPRKKVQFLVADKSELVDEGHTGVASENNGRKDVTLVVGNADMVSKVDDDYESESLSVEDELEDQDDEPCRLKRSLSERLGQGGTGVSFNDTMALRPARGRSSITDLNNTGGTTLFDAVTDLQRLDGIGPARSRPREPPPPPPPPQQPGSISERPATPPPRTATEANGYDVTTTRTTGKEDLQCNKMFADNETPPCVPPRKRSNSKQPITTATVITMKKNGINLELDDISNNKEVSSTESSKIIIKSEETIQRHTTLNYSYQKVKIEPSKTIVQITSPQVIPSTVHRLQIKNEFESINSYNQVSVTESPQRKTSIMINGDDCYSTVNVNDDVPIYQSSVVVNDYESSSKIDGVSSGNRSSSVYITGDFKSDSATPLSCNTESKFEERPKKTLVILEDNSSSTTATPKLECAGKSLVVLQSENLQEEKPSSEELQRLLQDPVEAVKRNLVPHVCGKADVDRKTKTKKQITSNSLVARLLEDPFLGSLAEKLETPTVAKLIEDSLSQLRNPMNQDDDKEICSENEYPPYELMEAGSDCYSNHSNRSSVTEDESGNRNKFYQLLADAALSEVEEHHYECIRPNVDPIYEEIEIPPPLPANPPPSNIIDDLQIDKQFTTRSIFEGASKYDILSYLVDAKERGIVPEESYTYNFNNSGEVIVEEEEEERKERVVFSRVSHMSTVSDSSEDSSLVITTDKIGPQKSAEVERNDSGVGSETSKCSRSRYLTQPEASLACEDCDMVVDPQPEDGPLICRKCSKKRSERKETITEIVETEEKYSRDLQIILEEFYQPMLVAGLLTPEQLSAIFLNVEELLENSQALAERLRDSLEIALEQGDEDLLTVNIGKIFLEAAPMLHAFESYCIRQGPASLLLASLEKEKELLRIFLRVSQMENTVLRRMNLNSFLMVPVQRVTKYPLLLTRLHKVTPLHHESRELLRDAQHKIELHLSHMNSETKDVPSKLWRRISSGSGRRSSSEMDLVNIKLRKIAVDVLEWNHDEARFALEGRLLFTQPTDNNWRKGRTIKLAPINALLVTNGKPNVSAKPDRTPPPPPPPPNNEEVGGLTFPRHTGVREAALLLVRDKGGRYSLLREPLYLDRCVIATDPAWQNYFEVQELLGKDTFIFKAEETEMTHTWYRQLQYHAQGMGAWRKRRNALANIMINGMGSRS